jgi:hypothetical protein
LTSGFEVKDDGFGRRTYLCTICKTKPTLDYRGHLESVSHVQKAREQASLLQTLSQARQGNITSHVHPMFLDSLAFVTPGVENPMGSDDGSEPEDLLVVTRQARLTLFDQANQEEEEDHWGIDWENLIFEIHENIHEDSGHGNPEDQSLERTQHSKWFPFKSQEVSSSSTVHAKNPN